MEILLLSLLYVFAHFTFYLIIGRNLPKFRTERGIFMWHFLSFILLGITGIVATVFLNIKSPLPSLLAILSLHGIYSLSFLELWSLSQGGFSLQILQAAPITTNAEKNLIAKLEAIGDDKFKDRIQSIQKIGLIQTSAGKAKLTMFGAIFAKLLFCIAKLNNIKDRG